jgi:beta-barrel assembly-enhancing protease
MRLQFGIALLMAWTLNAQDIDVQKESALGQQMAKDYRLRHAPLDSAAVRDYIEQVGQRLIDAMPNKPPFAYQFEPITDFRETFLEPVSVPGGYVFVPAGLILEARDEAEFAGLMAHAIGHISAWHQGSRVRQLATIPLIFMGDFGEPGAIVPVSQLAYESEADSIAVQLTTSAGYDPAGLASFITRVQPRPSAPGRLVGYPSRDARVEAMEQAIQALPRQNYASSADFARIQEEVRRLAPPPPAPPKPPTLKREQR